MSSFFSGREYSLSEVESHILSKKSQHPKTNEWHVRFFSGIEYSPNKLQAFQKWMYESPIHESYKRCDITYYTPSCNEMRIKVNTNAIYIKKSFLLKRDLLQSAVNALTSIPDVSSAPLSVIPLFTNIAKD